MRPVNLNPMVPISPGDLSRLKIFVKKALVAAKKIKSKTRAEQIVHFGGNMNNVTIGDINLTITVSAEIVDSLHEVKNIIDKLAISPPGSTPVKQIFYALPKQIEMDSLNLEEIKTRVVRLALDKHGWNRTHAAEELGVSVRGLRDWINKYGLKG